MVVMPSTVAEESSVVLLSVPGELPFSVIWADIYRCVILSQVPIAESPLSMQDADHLRDQVPVAVKTFRASPIYYLYRFGPEFL